MKFLYMIEHKLIDDQYRPIGIWCLGEGLSLDLEIRMLPEYPNEQEEADWIVNRIVESGVRRLDRALLEYHQQTMSPYDGMRSKIVETDKYPTRDALFDDLLKQIREGRTK